MGMKHNFTVIQKGVFVLAMLNQACGANAPYASSGTVGGGRLSSITVGLPDTSRLGEGRQKRLNGYRVVIETLDPACPRASSIDATVRWGAAASQHKIAQGCDYSIGMELGELKDPATSRAELARVFFTNISGPRDGHIVRKEDIAGKDSLALNLILKVTAAGREAGFGGNLQGESNQLAFDWRAVLKTVDVPETRWSGQDHGSAFYRDIMDHVSRRYTSDSATTNGHESLHFLHSEVRNRAGGKVNVVYPGGGKAAIIPEPAMHAREARKYVPETLKKVDRYNLYMVSQIDRSWSEVLYIFDEWGGYRADLRIAVELLKAGNQNVLGNEACSGDGAAEFLHFAAAAITALKINEPLYLENQQFKAAFAMLASETATLLKEVSADGKIDCNASRYLDHFRTSPEAEQNRQTLREYMGSVWTSQVLGF